MFCFAFTIRMDKWQRAQLSFQGMELFFYLLWERGRASSGWRQRSQSPMTASSWQNGSGSLIHLICVRDREDQVCWCQTVCQNMWEGSYLRNIYYSSARNSRITSPVSYSSLTNLSHLSPTKAGGVIPNNSVSADEVQFLMRNSAKITLAQVMMFGFSSWMWHEHEHISHRSRKKWKVLFMNNSYISAI